MTCSDCKAEEINRQMCLEVRLQKVIDLECKLHSAIADLIMELGRMKQFLHERQLYGKGEDTNHAI